MFKRDVTYPVIVEVTSQRCFGYHTYPYWAELIKNTGIDVDGRRWAWVTETWEHEGVQYSEESPRSWTLLDR